MKIADSAIQLYSQHISIEKHQKQESLAVWGPGEEPVLQSLSDNKGHKIDIQKEINAFNTSSSVEFSKQGLYASQLEAVDVNASEENEVMMDLNIRILKAMIERITGRKINLNSFQSLPSANNVPVEQMNTSKVYRYISW